MIDRIDALRSEAEAAIGAAGSSQALEAERVRWLGRKAALPNLLRGVAQLEPAERASVGRLANEARQALEALIAARAQELEAAELDARLAADRVDVTLPGEPPQTVGRLHLVTQTWRELEEVFRGLGFTVLEGPEVELVHYNFDALNFLPTHPSRSQMETFYTTAGHVLRVHTSPMQVRAMEAHPPPLYVVIPGRTFRRDSDATHTPMFHQLEGLAVDEDITLADLKGTLLESARQVFGADRDVRLRPHFFPFTEPSVEVDVSCFRCGGTGWLPDGARCPVCKGEGWLEILGAGEVDPNVYDFVDDPRYDGEKVQGFAWGMGIDRIAMLKHGVTDLRLLFDNDVRFLEQFG
jgi:phenylalanyl-tRNA synthetase alpha chain